MTIISAIPVVIGQMEYYQLYELQGQAIEDVRDGEYNYKDVLVMDVMPYAYEDGTYKLRTEKNLVGGIVGVDAEGMSPVPNALTGGVVHMYFAEENAIRGDLQDDEMVVVRWAWGIGGYHIKGVMPLDAYDNSDFIEKLETNPNNVQAQKYIIAEMQNES